MFIKSESKYDFHTQDCTIDTPVSLTRVDIHVPDAKNAERYDKQMFLYKRKPTSLTRDVGFRLYRNTH